MAKTKTEGEWTSRTLAEHKVTDSVVWRAQISTSPDGKEFAGVRKYIKKRDGTEIADRAGMSFPYDAGTLPENCQAMIELFTALKGGTVKVGTKKVTGAGETPKVVKTKVSKQTGTWVICDCEGNYMANGGDPSPEVDNAYRFADEDTATAYLTDKVKNRKQRALYSVHDLSTTFGFVQGKGTDVPAPVKRKKVKVKPTGEPEPIKHSTSFGTATKAVVDPLAQAKRELSSRVGQVYNKGGLQYLSDDDMKEQTKGTHRRRG